MFKKGANAQKEALQQRANCKSELFVDILNKRCHMLHNRKYTGNKI